jgi:anti-repressor protein
MTDLVTKVFEGAPVRVVMVDGEPHMVGKDVAERLGYANASDAMNKHCRGVAKRYPIVDALGRTQEVRVLSESDVMRLIVSSKLPAAERFERWLFEEVIPTIRKTGGYMVAAPEETTEELTVRLMGILHDTIARQKAQLALVGPKAEVLDRISTADGLLNITATAKVIGVKPKVLFAFMRRHGWIYYRPGATGYLGYQSQVNAGLLDHKVSTINMPDGTEKMVQNVYVTAKGVAKLAALFPQQGELAA